MNIDFEVQEMMLLKWEWENFELIIFMKFCTELTCHSANVRVRTRSLSRRDEYFELHSEKQNRNVCVEYISYHINAPANLFIIISTVRIWNENSPNQSSFYIRTTNYTISICSILNAFPKCSPEVPTQSTNLHQTINSTKSHAFGFERKTYRSKISCESTNTP